MCKGGSVTCTPPASVFLVKEADDPSFVENAKNITPSLIFNFYLNEFLASSSNPNYQSSSPRHRARARRKIHHNSQFPQSLLYVHVSQKLSHSRNSSGRGNKSFENYRFCAWTGVMLTDTGKLVWNRKVYSTFFFEKDAFLHDVWSKRRF